MKLITEVKLPDYPFSIGHHVPSLFLGSCFAENIGRQMKRSMFPVNINPFGVIYNPASVLAALEALLRKEAYTEEDLHLYEGKWFSFDHYTGFSGREPEQCLEKINASFLGAKEVISDAGVLVVTWGTSWVYRYNPTGNVVNNCHKIPARDFTRFRLTPEEICRTYSVFLPELFRSNPDLKVLLTVSPVRHWKDGARENQLSKSVLLLATRELEERFPDRVCYFPSYEIVMDELRDYRFYAGDMLHMNPVATRYIWERFSRVLISEESRRIMSDLEPLLKLQEHRPRESSGPDFERTRQIFEEKQEILKTRYPFLPW